MDSPRFEGYRERKDSQLLDAIWRYDNEHEGTWQDGPHYCGLCRKIQPFRSTAAEGSDVNMREDVLCDGCGLNARTRAAIQLFVEHVRPTGDARIYATEQVTATFVWLQKHLPCNVQGSEFEPDSDKRKALSERLAGMGGTGPVQFNDITDSRFHDATFDGIISLDVLEHVPDYRKSISEFSRTLQPGGVLVATFPFADTEQTLVRARRREDGSVLHLLDPEYHGDPISGGVLCWYHFGWDVLGACRDHGFRRASMLMPWSPVEAMRFGLWTLVAEK